MAIVSATIPLAQTPYAKQGEARPDVLATGIRDALRRLESRIEFLRRLEDLLKDDSNWDEECLPPTRRAVEAVETLLDAATEQIILPEGILYPDGNGGLRLEWRSVDRARYVLLNVHPTFPQQDYLYCQQDDRQGDLETEPTVATLIAQLQWLTAVAGPL